MQVNPHCLLMAPPYSRACCSELALVTSSVLVIPFPAKGRAQDHNQVSVVCFSLSVPVVPLDCSKQNMCKAGEATFSSFLVLFFFTTSAGHFVPHLFLKALSFHRPPLWTCAPLPGALIWRSATGTAHLSSFPAAELLPNSFRWSKWSQLNRASQFQAS